MKSKTIEWLKQKDIIAFLAIIISIITLFYTCSNDKKIEEINYRITSIEHKPHIDVAKIEIVSLENKIDSIEQSNYNNSPEDTLSLYMSSIITFKINIVNMGNTNAKLDCVCIIDTTSQDDFLKKLLTRQKLDSIENQLEFTYPLIELKPSDTMSVSFERSIQWIKGNIFTIHILFFYENDLKQLYDTYYWARFKYNEIICKTEFNPTNKTLTLKNTNNTTSDYVHQLDHNSYSKCYDEKEKKEILKILKEYSTQIKKR